MANISTFEPKFFKLIDFELICETRNFSLPDYILTSQIRINRVRSNTRTSTRQPAAKTIKKTNNGNGEGSYRPYPSRKRRTGRQLDDEKIKALPAFLESLFSKQTMPSTLVEGVYKLKEEEVINSFIDRTHQNDFSNWVDMLFAASKEIEENDVKEIISIFNDV
ncbi:9490_t:CDS:2 [Diversispora eburnea]|uniref:9490_t:CDS:1 n=1 Tax=Diversispora eburnea TaxID=1213867 RepID=A0A9N8V3E3_9GLOM|nr:9490_t:CDS:2 [Diversispora eburnea]